MGPALSQCSHDICARCAAISGVIALLAHSVNGAPLMKEQDVPGVGANNMTMPPDGWGLIAERVFAMGPPPSLMKCLGATLAGSMFALLGMVIEGIRQRGEPGKNGKQPAEKAVNKAPHGSRLEQRPDAVGLTARPRLSSASSLRQAPMATGSSASPPACSDIVPSFGDSEEGTDASSARPAQSTQPRQRWLRWRTDPPSEAEPSASRTPLSRGSSPSATPGAGTQPACSSESREESPSWKRSSPDVCARATRPASTLLFRNIELPEAERTNRQVKSILNKLTREKFDKLYEQLLDCCKTTTAHAELIEVVAKEVFAKATLQHHFVDMYADLCSKLHSDLPKANIEVNFKRALLDQCQQSFDLYLDPPRIDECLTYEEQYEELVKYKTKMLGNVRLIGHLLQRRMLSPKIIFHVTDELLGIGSAEALETLCTFLGTIGATFDNPQWPAHSRLDEVFTRVEVFADDARQGARIRCLLKDLLDRRRSRWRERPEAPSTTATSELSRHPSRNRVVTAHDEELLRSRSAPECALRSFEARAPRRFPGHGQTAQNFANLSHKGDVD